MSRIQGGPAQQVGPVATPRGAAAGARVDVVIDGLLPEDVVLIGFGGVGTPHEILGQATAAPDGVASLQVVIPEWVEAGRTYLFYMAWEDQRPVSFSEPFVATHPDGTVRIRGTVTAMGEPCRELTGEDGTRYWLIGPRAAIDEGVEVIVDGVLTDDGPCPDGLTLRVAAARPWSGDPD